MLCELYCSKSLVIVTVHMCIARYINRINSGLVQIKLENSANFRLQIAWCTPRSSQMVLGTSRPTLGKRFVSLVVCSATPSTICSGSSISTSTIRTSLPTYRRTSERNKYGRKLHECMKRWKIFRWQNACRCIGYLFYFIHLLIYLFNEPLSIHT